MPRLSTPCPRPREQGSRKNRHETLQLEVDESRRKARRVQPRCEKERVRILRLVGVECGVERRGVLREMGRPGGVLARGDAPRKKPSILLGQLRKEIVRVPHE